MIFEENGFDSRFLTDVVSIQNVEDWDYFLPAILVSYKSEKDPSSSRINYTLVLHIVIPKRKDSLTVFSVANSDDIDEMLRSVKYCGLLRKMIEGESLPGTGVIYFHGESSGYHVRNQIKDIDLPLTDVFTQTYKFESIEVVVSFGVGTWIVGVDNVVSG
jgi:hypothetical protein